jgi:putative tricarboxylic transport membrane protein
VDAVILALQASFTPLTLGMLTLGVLCGLVIGAIPGVGGLFGLAILVPLTYHLDPVAAIALLLGLASVTTTSDTIPAVLIGVPGTVGAITTVLDGHPLARQGQARRALGAAYLSSILGGVFGAIVLAAAIPLLRPLILLLQTPDFFAIACLGLLFVAFVSGPKATKGLAALLLGIMASFVGLDRVGGAERYSFGNVYFWDGISLSAAFLGIFGLPELAGLWRRKSVAEMLPGSENSKSTVVDGFRDVMREWRLLIACSSLGALIGAIPGVGVTIIDWVAYGFAKRRLNGGPPFGEGNIRGVIAPESANNAKEGGYLIPTVAFGLPGSVSMAFILAALTMHGLVPGPAMLGRDLHVTYSMVIFLVLANIMGGLVCLAFTGQLARIATLPSSTILPIAVVFIAFGAFQENANPMDIVVLVVFGILGTGMKAYGWPRAAFSLGFVLGPSLERYFFLSYQLSGWSWLTRPAILVVAVAGALVVANSIVRRRSAHPVHLTLPDAIGFLLLAAVAVWYSVTAIDLPFTAKLFPLVTSAFMLLVCALGVGFYFFRSRKLRADPTEFADDPLELSQSGAIVMGLAALVVALTYFVGAPIAAFVLVSGLIYIRERKLLRALLVGIPTGVVVYLVFTVLAHTQWPRPLLLPF